MSPDTPSQVVKALVNKGTRGVAWIGNVLSVNVSAGTVDVTLRGSGTVLRQVSVSDQVDVSVLTANRPCVVILDSDLQRFVCIATIAPTGKVKISGADANYKYPTRATLTAHSFARRGVNETVLTQNLV